MRLKFLPTRILRKRELPLERKLSVSLHRAPSQSGDGQVFLVDEHHYLAHAVFCIGWNAPRHRELFIQRSHATGVHMDREHIKGAADKAKGAIKDAAGKVTGDKELQTEGKLDKAKGAAHNAAGDVKDALRNASKDE